MAKYKIGQFNQGVDSIDAANGVFMTSIYNATPVRRENKLSDSLIVGQGLVFKDEGLKLNSGKFEKNTTYYLHVKIKQKKNPQIFDIFLAEDGSVTEDANSEKTLTDTRQYLKTIEVLGDSTEVITDDYGNEIDASGRWADYEFLFTPGIDNQYDIVWFRLQREQSDYTVEPRYPVLIYCELAKVNNLIGSSATNIPNKSFIKMGVQSHPGLMMCVNNEEIHIGRSGVYELRDGIISTTFFGVVFGMDVDLSEDCETLDTKIRQERIEHYERLRKKAEGENDNSPRTVNPIEEGTYSVAALNEGLIRNIDSFVLDYMYKDGIDTGTGTGSSDSNAGSESENAGANTENSGAGTSNSETGSESAGGAAATEG